MSRVREEGTVDSIKGNEAKVRIPRRAACAGCGSCAASAELGSMISTVRTVRNLQVGDRVVLEGSTPSSITGGLTLFILPLSLFVVGFAAGQSAAPGLTGNAEDGELIGGLLGLFLAVLPYLLLFLRRQRDRRHGRYALQIAEVLPRQRSEHNQ